MVRQAIILYLVNEKAFSIKHLSVERAIRYNTMNKRYDLVVFNKNKEALILVECKSPEVSLDQSSIDQASLYNQELNVRYLWISNGHKHYIFEMDYEHATVARVEDIPGKN